MKCRSFVWAAAVLCAVMVPGMAFGDVVVNEGFEGPLPGPVGGYPGNGGYSYWGDGDSAVDLGVTQEVIDTDSAPGPDPLSPGLQSFRFTVDTSPPFNSWWYFGMGGAHSYSWTEGNGAAGGQPGEDIAANFTMSFDIKVEGFTGDYLAEGNVTLYKADYEAVYGVDLNNSGEMENGYSTWNSSFSVNMGAISGTGWQHVEWNLGSGSAPVAPNNGGDGVGENPPPLYTPLIFDDESVFNFQIYPFQNSGAWGLDADNVVIFDNVALEFVPSTATPGDFDGDGDADGRDFLVWQRGETTPALDPGLLAEWQGAYGGGGALAAIGAVPEPGSLLLAAMSVALLAGRRRAA